MFIPTHVHLIHFLLIIFSSYLALHIICYLFLSFQKITTFEFLENNNKILWEEIVNIRSQSEKCEACELLRNNVTCLHETLGKFIKDKKNLILILFSQRASYNKNALCYKPNKSFSTI